MRLRDENKRRAIIQAAAKLFSEQPFHKVRLDDVASAAGIGKGTVYIYFKSKEDLYYSLVYDGLAELVKRLGERLGSESRNFRDRLRLIIRGVVDFAIQHPQLFEVMRTAGVPDASSDWDIKRQELSRLIEGTIRQGVAAGEFTDKKPEWTAVYLPSMVRAVMLYSPSGVEAATLNEHITEFVLAAIGSDRT
ncbi:MAG: TetR/AcrR family transcriptional regulator [Tepidisphaeraceae bacterium]|jgi:AcrR family transcriptional regulator